MKTIIHVVLAIFLFSCPLAAMCESASTSTSSAAVKSNPTRLDSSVQAASAGVSKKSNDGEIKTTMSVNPLNSKERQVNISLSELESQLSDLRISTKSINSKLSKSYFTPAITGLIGVLLGGFLTFFTQRSLAKDSREFEIGKSIYSWRFQQMLELYAPLHALFSHSTALYRQMNQLLITKDSNKFRFQLDESGAELDRQMFQIRMPDGWVQFRTITHIGEVYGREYGIDDYFDEIVAVGKRIASVIEEKSGYADPEQEQLAGIFGKYLAHYSVLSRVHSAMQSRGTEGQQPISVDQSAVFPTEMLQLIDQGYKSLTSRLKSWPTNTL